ncbi:hypothetical protein D9M68_264290 [compost metagenome]|nr:hypothetical protein N184_29150 [Sinorhizobium sp. GL28]
MRLEALTLREVPVLEVSDEVWAQTLNVYLIGYVCMARAVLPTIRTEVSDRSSGFLHVALKLWLAFA